MIAPWSERKCTNCEFYKYKENRKCCDKYNFLMPVISGAMICKSWKHEDYKNPFFELLEPNHLYFYSTQSELPPQSLGSFDSLAQPLLDATIHNDDELGWVIYITDRKEYFPDLGNNVILTLDDEDYEFCVVDANRQSVNGGKRLDTGQWEHYYSECEERILYSLNYPLVISNWLDKYFFMDKYFTFLSQHQFREPLLSVGIYIFIKVDSKISKFSLVLNRITFPSKFLRS